MRRIGLIALPILAILVLWKLQPDDRRAPRAPTAKGDAAPEAAAPADEEKAAPAPKAGSRHVFDFLVVTTAGGDPLSGVEIRAGGSTGKTAADGTLRLVHATEEFLEVVATKEGYLAAKGYADAGSTVTLRLERGLPVAGGVLFAGSGAPAAGASVRAWDLDAEEEMGATLIADDQGRFAVGGVRPDRPFRLVAWMAGYAPVFVRKTIDAPVRDLVIGIGAGGVLEGAVLDAAGAPAAGLELLVLAPGDPLPPRRDSGSFFIGDEAAMVAFSTPRARTDARGAYRIRGLPLGVDRAAVVRVSPYFTGRSDPFRFSADGDVQRRDIRLPRPATLRVDVKDKDGERLPDVQVDLVTERVTYSSNEPLFAAVTPGRYLLRVRPRGGSRRESRIELREGEKKTVEVVVSGSMIEGVVVGADGKPLGMVAVSWRGMELNAITDERGRFRLTAPEGSAGTLRVDPLSYEEYVSQEIENVAPGGKPLRIVLTRSGFIEGRLVDLPKGTEVGTTYLSEALAGGSLVELDEAGRFRHGTTRTGEPFVFKIEFEGYAPWVSKQGPLKEGETRDLGDIRLDRGRVARATVVDESGTPVTGVPVLVAERWTRATARTNKRGTFEFPRMPRKPLGLRIEAPGLPPHFFRLDAETPTPPTLVVGRGHPVRGHCTLGPGSVVRFRVDAPEFDGDRAVVAVQTGPDGRFRLRLQAGRYRARVWDAKTKKMHAVPVVVRPGETTTVKVGPPR